MLTPKEQKRLKKCELGLAMPKWKYILIYGLTWGITVAISITFSEWVFEGKSLRQQRSYELLIRFIIFLIAGIFMGWYSRRITTKQVIKLKKKEQAD